MWWEIIPSTAIVYGLIVAPALVSYGSNKYIKGKYFHRNGKAQCRNWLQSKHDFTGYMRDRHISGSEYIPKGLQDFPDK